MSSLIYSVADEIRSTRIGRLTRKEPSSFERNANTVLGSDESGDLSLCFLMTVAWRDLAFKHLKCDLEINHSNGSAQILINIHALSFC